MNESITPDGEGAWAPCEAGRISGLASRLQSDHTRRVRQRAMRSATIGTGALAMLVAIVAAWPGAGPTPDTGKLACADCQERFPEYAAFLTADSAGPTQRVQETIDHLAKCPACKAAFADQYPGMKGVAASYGFTTLAALAAVAGTRRWSSHPVTPRG